MSPIVNLNRSQTDANTYLYLPKSKINIKIGLDYQDGFSGNKRTEDTLTQPYNQNA